MHRRLALVLFSLALAGSGPALSSNRAQGALKTAPTADSTSPSAWARIATRDIERAHAIIQDAHPAVLDPTDTAFHQWFGQGYAQAMQLARRAQSEEQAHAALRFYTTGYRDGHLAAWLTNPPHTAPLWAGWRLQWRGGAYRVSARAAQWPVGLPQIGDEALSCDGRPINDLLTEKVAPFVDRLMHLDGTRSRLAQHLTQERPYTPLWEPLRSRQCEIRSVTGEVRSFPLRWQPAQDEDALVLTGPTAPRQGAKQLQPGVHWVHASNFMPSSPRALAALEVTLEKIQRMANAKAVVLDTRGNEEATPCGAIASCGHCSRMQPQESPPSQDPRPTGGYRRPHARHSKSEKTGSGKPRGKTAKPTGTRSRSCPACRMPHRAASHSSSRPASPGTRLQSAPHRGLLSQES